MLPADSPSLLRQFRLRVEYVTLRALAGALHLLPRSGVLLIAKGLGAVVYAFDSRSRGTALENLRMVFPDSTPDWRTRTARRSFQQFAKTMLELFWSSNLANGRRHAYHTLQMDDPEAIEVVRKSGALWCCAHYGNFEWLSHHLGWWGIKKMIVAQDLKNPVLTSIFTSLRTVSGHSIISSDGAMIRLFKNLKRGGNSSFLTDLTLRPDESSTIIRCFGRKTCLTLMHAALAQRTGLPIVPMMSIPQPDGTYVLRLWKPVYFTKDTGVAVIAQSIWDLFEPIILANPEPWLWSYKHWRYLPQDPEGLSYPAYANRSRKFDKLEASVTAKPAPEGGKTGPSPAAESPAP